MFNSLNIRSEPNKQIDISIIGSIGTFDYIIQSNELPSLEKPYISSTLYSTVSHGYYGGCAFNSGVAAAKLGLKTALICPIGNDFEESGYMCYLKEHSIDTSGLIKDKGGKSSYCLMLHDKKGNTFCVMYRLPFRRPSDNNMNNIKQMISNSRCLLVTPLLTDYYIGIMEKAQSSYCLIALSGICGLRQNKVSTLKKAINLADILFCNEREISQIMKQLNYGSVDQLLRKGLQVIFITQGKRGSKVISHKKNYQIPAVKTFAKDLTGAGDAYASGATASLLWGHDILTAARLGSILASFVVEEIGAQTNLPNIELVLDRFQKSYGYTFNIPDF